MTEQEAFDKAVRGLAAQGWERSMLDPDKVQKVTGGFFVQDPCAYLSEEGLKCAVGQLLTDEQLELYGSMYLPVEGLVANYDVPQLKGLNQEFLVDLQHAHDTALDPADMGRRFGKVAGKYGLNDTVLRGLVV